MTPLMMLLIAVLLTSYSNVMIKFRVNAAAAQDTGMYFLALGLDPWVWTSVVALAVAIVLYLLALREIDVSAAQPIFASVVVAVPIAAAIFLDEAPSATRIVGIALIAAGALLVTRTI